MAMNKVAGLERSNGQYFNANTKGYREAAS
jgi:hypothetical protein